MLANPLSPRPLPDRLDGGLSARAPLDRAEGKPRPDRPSTPLATDRPGSAHSAGLRCSASSLPTDQSRPRVTRSRYRGSSTVALLWPRVVEKTLVFSLYMLVQATTASAVISLPVALVSSLLPFLGVAV